MLYQAYSTEKIPTFYQVSRLCK